MLTHTLVSLCEGAMDADDRAGPAGRRPWFPLLPVVALWYTDAGGRHLEEVEHSVSNSGTNIVVPLVGEVFLLFFVRFFITFAHFSIAGFLVKL